MQQSSSVPTSPVLSGSSRPTSPERHYIKTLRLTSDQLKQLNLKKGANTITFSLSASGVVACTARIFLWDSSDLIVVSDIDGTITKSDALGHVFTMIGRDSKRQRTTLWTTSCSITRSNQGSKLLCERNHYKSIAPCSSSYFSVSD